MTRLTRRDAIVGAAAAVWGTTTAIPAQAAQRSRRCRLWMVSSVSTRRRGALPPMLGRSCAGVGRASCDALQPRH